MFKKRLSIILVMLSVLLFTQLALAVYVPQLVYAEGTKGYGAEHYLYLIVAANNELEQFHRDAAYMTAVLVNDYYGYRYDEEGLSLRYLHPEEDYLQFPYQYGKATKESVKSNITDWLGSESDGNDHVFIYIGSHGGGFNAPEGKIDYGRIDGSAGDPVDEGAEHYINGSWHGVDECIVFANSTGKYYYWDDELAEDLDEIDYGTLTVFIDACYSGGFLADLGNETENRIILTSANETYYSWTDQDWRDNDEDGFSEFVEGFVDAMHRNNTKWDPLCTYVPDGELPDDPNVDEDAHLSVWEAFDYAYKHDTARLAVRTNNFTQPDPWDNSAIDESPWYDDDGDGLSTDDDGDLGKQTFLFRMSSDLNDDGTIDIFDLVTVSGAYGSTPGDPNWNPDADINNDNAVDIFDLVLVAGSYGWEGNPYATPSGGKARGDAVFSVCPDEITVYRHESFNVNVTITNATDLYGWEFKLYWNNTLLNCTGVEIHAPDVWGENVFEAGDGIQNDFNATHGRYFKAMAALYPAFSFNGSMAVVTLTFEAKVTGSSTLDLKDTKLSDSEACAISHTTVDGFVTVLPQMRYMRGDKHTVNNLEAYKLTTSQSATQKTSTKEASGRKTVYWGIRVWKRNSAGTETEITGGTSVAQVSRSGNGQGIQSNTWNCPQISLQETDAIVVRVYMKFGSGSWKLCCTFITEQLESEQLDSSQWTVYYYTWRYYASWEKKTYGFFRWGTSTYNSRIANFEYT